MKAIETQYKGYRFRSRLEARWAVYFDSLGLHWEYEKEGFDLDGVWYLPDFWLVEVKMWAEVKPTNFTSMERHKCICLASATSNPVLMLNGSPDFKYYEAVYPPSHPQSQDVGCFILSNEYIFTEQRFFWADDDDIAYDCSSVYDAIEASRSARFEFGEMASLYA